MCGIVFATKWQNSVFKIFSQFYKAVGHFMKNTTSKVKGSFMGSFFMPATLA